jgi:Na+-driven multidrug efflux pump
MCFAGLCILVFEIFASPICSLFIGEPVTLAMSTKFLRILCLAVPLMIMNFQMSFTFQAMGMGKQSLILSSMRQGLVNIPLLFIMNHFFGLYGVVWTQLIADTITASISYYVYKRSYSGLLAKRMSIENEKEPEVIDAPDETKEDSSNFKYPNDEHLETDFSEQ